MLYQNVDHRKFDIEIKIFLKSILEFDCSNIRKFDIEIINSKNKEKMIRINNSISKKG